MKTIDIDNYPVRVLTKICMVYVLRYFARKIVLGNKKRYKKIMYICSQQNNFFPYLPYKLWEK